MSQRGGVFSEQVFRPLLLELSEEVIKYAKNAPKNKKNGGVMWMCAEHQFLGVRAGGHFLVLLHYIKLKLDRRCYKNQTLFPLVPEGKEKIYFQDVHF